MLNLTGFFSGTAGLLAASDDIVGMVLFVGGPDQGRSELRCGLSLKDWRLASRVPRLLLKLNGDVAAGGWIRVWFGGREATTNQVIAVEVRRVFDCGIQIKLI